MHKKLFLGLAAAISSASFAITIENESLRIEFAEADNGFAVEGIVNRLSGDVRFVKPTGPATFWKLDFVSTDANGKCVQTTIDNNATSASRTVETHGDVTSFRWRGIDIANERGAIDVTANVRLPAGKGASEWTLEIKNRSKRFALHTTNYPCLGEVIGIGVGDALMPTGNLGASLRKNYTYWDDAHADYKRPSPGWSPPLVAFNLGNAGLYIGAHDPTQRLKQIVIKADHSVTFETIVENAGLPGLAADGPRHPVIIAAYSGDWWQAAKIYRNWALKQEWAKKGMIATRKDFPKALADTDLLFRFNEKNPQMMSNNIVQLKKIFPDLKLSIHWYCWSQQPYCVNFPEFFPALPDVKETVEFAHQQNVKIVPYVDPRLWDIDLVSWAYAKHDACRSMEGDLTIEEYYPKHKLAVMCPTREAWHEVAMKMTTDAVMGKDECINGCGFDGAYHDQVACSRQVPCWAANHTHAKGGGDWWFKSHRKTFGEIHDWCAQRGAMLLSEGTGDMCLDQFDGFLKASGIRADEVPFYPAVYAGYAIYFGNYQSLKDDPNAFYAYQMRDFSSGVLLGWLDRWNVTSTEFTAHQQCLTTCARTRRAASEFMIYGTLEDELRFLTSPEPQTFLLQSIWRKYDYHYTLPLVTGTVWKSADAAATGVIVANASDKPQTVTFRLPVRGLSLVHINGMPSAQFSSTNGIGTLTIPARSTAFLRTAR